jgi:hypothetical protein
MADVTILGTGDEARVCGEVLAHASFKVHHAFELDPNDHNPVIVGEVSGALHVTRDAIEAGRPVLIAGTHFLTPDRLGSLFDIRRRNQALFVWNARRYHPGFRLVTGLMESDPNWRPRHLRHEWLSMDAPSTAAVRWNALEAISLVTALAEDQPQVVMANALLNTKRNCPDLLTMKVAYREVESLILVGLGEGIERHETLIAAPTRKVLVDGLSYDAPVRVIDDEALYEPVTRWLSCPTASPHELARQQCVAFLEAAAHPALAKQEAVIWLQSLATLDAVDRSLAANGAGMLIRDEAPQPRVRVLTDLRPVTAA